MLAIVTIGLSCSLLLLFGLALFAFLEVAALGPPAAELPQTTPVWQPPLAQGDQLLAWAREMATAVTTKRLADPASGVTAAQLASEIYEGSMYAITQSPHAVTQTEPECASCRNHMIGVTAPEMLAIVDELRRTRSPGEVTSTRERAAKNADRVAAIGGARYERAEVVCPLFSDDGSCEAFESRPLQCRGWCHYAGEDGDRCLLAGSDAVSLDAHAHTVGSGAEAGLSTGLKAAGLDGSVYELNSALVAALDTPAAAERWADGEPVFARCKLYDKPAPGLN